MAQGTRVVVLGAGPGGYPAAFLAADRKMDVTLIDTRPQAGGVCLHEGCIPSKALLHVARLLGELRQAAAWGLEGGAPRVDLERLRAWKEKVVAGLSAGLDGLARQRRVRRVHGRARFLDSGAVEVGGSRIEFDYAIVATGSRPRTLEPLFAPDHPAVWDSTAALQLRHVPRTLLVVGGGYIGLEVGTIFAALGTRVTVVEMTPGLLPGVDRDLVVPLEASLRERFEEILVSTRVVAAELESHGARVKLAGISVRDPERQFERVLVAVGRRPNTDDLGLEHTAVRTDEGGFIEVDSQFRTADRRIFAIGDVVRGPALAHKATAEAATVVEAIAGEPAAWDASAIPAVVFTDPEVAWCGLMEEAARRRGLRVETTLFPWAASGRAATMGRRDGVTKLVLQPRTGRILGVGITGLGAGELIGEGALAVEMGATADDLAGTIHAHPTLAETLREAAELYRGHSPHALRRRAAAR